MLNAPRRARPETDRQIGDLVRVGIIDAVDLAAGKAVVSFGDAKTPPIDWLMPVGDVTVWLAPTVGAQVLVLQPEADPAQGVIMNGLPSSSFAPLFSGEKTAIRFKDGSSVTYDPTAGTLNVDAIGKVNIVAPDGARVEGDLHVTGKIHADDEITSDGDIIADEVSLKEHVHGDVAAGQAKTGEPE